MKRRNMIVAIAGGLMVLAASLGGLQAQTGENDGPQFQDNTDLLFPHDYREWIFLSSGLGMTYVSEEGDSASESAREPRFQNVFVNPSSYAHFMEHGTWPDHSIFVLEIRQSSSEASINEDGRFQTDLAVVEAEVKDSRFEDGWAFYNFGDAGREGQSGAPLAGNRGAACIACHTEHTAVERTFVQFYPTLLDVAREKGTLKTGFE